jgi:dTDP-glucose 4,6-dehydratase
LKLLVTGGLGFIGSNYVKYHLTEHPEDTIVNLDKGTYAASPLAFKELRKFHNNLFVKGDICSRKVVERCLKGVDAVVHFAAETHVDRSIKSPVPFVRTNVLGTLTLLNAARMCGVNRFHHVSTDEVYGSLNLESDEKFNEETRYSPRNPYSASKASSDFLVQAFHETYGLYTTISNCSNNFGPFQNAEKLIPKSILNALSNRPIPIYGDGKNVRDWLYVEDHCSAIDRILEKGRPGTTYCVSAAYEYSNVEMVRMILRAMGKDDRLIRFVEDRPGHDLRYALDSTRIRSELGWKPKHELEESLVSTIGWYTQHKNVLGAGD